MVNWRRIAQNWLRRLLNATTVSCPRCFGCSLEDEYGEAMTCEVCCGAGRLWRLW